MANSELESNKESLMALMHNIGRSNAQSARVPQEGRPKCVWSHEKHPALDRWPEIRVSMHKVAYLSRIRFQVLIIF